MLVACWQIQGGEQLLSRQASCQRRYVGALDEKSQWNGCERVLFGQQYTRGPARVQMRESDACKAVQGVDVSSRSEAAKEGRRVRGSEGQHFK